MDSIKFEQIILALSTANTADALNSVNAMFDDSDVMSSQQETIFDAILAPKLVASLTKADDVITQARTMLSLSPVSEYISMSYVAKRFFNKSRSWLNNKINGRSSDISKEELNTLIDALNTMSKELSDTALKLSC